MQPIGPLMIEHRLIERMIRILSVKAPLIEQTRQVDPPFIDNAVDFIRTYADLCHHGKEEDILFRELKKKQLSSEHRKIMDDLIKEHVWGRQTTQRVVAAKEDYLKGGRGAVDELARAMKELAGFYPVHIAKEDKQFFIPVMKYFTEAEKDAMLQESWEFDRKLIHEKYLGMVEKIESK